jgi:hypothetical protein
MDITDLAGLSEPLKRLIEVVSSGIGNVSKPYLIRKTSEAKAFEIKTISKAIAESQKLLGDIEYNDGKIKITPTTAVRTLWPALQQNPRQTHRVSGTQ